MKRIKAIHKQTLIATALVAMVFTNPLVAQDTATDDTAAAELATKLANPVAALITVPVQNNWTFGIGPANATRPTSSPSSSALVHVTTPRSQTAVRTEPALRRQVPVPEMNNPTVDD